MADLEIEINGGIVVYEFVGPEDGEVVVLTRAGGSARITAASTSSPTRSPPAASACCCGTGRIAASPTSSSTASRNRTCAPRPWARSSTSSASTRSSRQAARAARATPSCSPSCTRTRSRKLITWAIVGGSYSSMLLANVYVINELRTVRRLGIEGVMEMGAGPFGWKACIEANPRNRQRLADIGAEEFERVMNRWLDAYIPKPNEAIPGVPDYQFAGIDVPTLVVRGGAKDYDHPPRTSFEVHSLIKGSRLIDPPWPEDAWKSPPPAPSPARAACSTSGTSAPTPSSSSSTNRAGIGGWRQRPGPLLFVIPAQAGIQRPFETSQAIAHVTAAWIPACAGMTREIGTDTASTSSPARPRPILRHSRLRGNDEGDRLAPIFFDSSQASLQNPDRRWSLRTWQRRWNGRSGPNCSRRPTRRSRMR